MKQESIEEAIKIITDNIYNSGINVIDKYELLLNINHFLTHYEEETKSKVLKKVKNDRAVTK
jgi:hypothetical protein